MKITLALENVFQFMFSDIGHLIYLALAEVIQVNVLVRGILDLHTGDVSVQNKIQSFPMK
jgi:hypothetical protein